MLNLTYYNLGWNLDNKSTMKPILSTLVDMARKQGIKCYVNKDGTIGKYTTIGKVKINLRKYSIDFGDFATNYWDLASLDINNFLLLIETTNNSIAMRLT